MPELTPQDRLQPALLDRLTDLAPHIQREARSARVVSRAQLRQSVLRDLGWLLNSVRPRGFIDAARYPFAADSVLNYGLPSLTGQAIMGLPPAALAEDIALNILRFEPRILADTLRVTPLKDARPSPHPTLSFHIEGVLWAQPYPEQLFYRADLDLEDSIFYLRETTKE
ncbi:type VI secretion system baseplate subunit TssE [Paludibacterium purpuratum]|uniref:Type VI secretion system protein ImpF n=1 Tax=Paludibacterium purpuratum TaxID=1144873 RepID=A0A4R7B467_9NEIS|nr:type VI secretion system baseplate subunit TssE [Paludibacterium purpuratum]TDR78361.1 type VI secretion system protein ImpF [Paludibacterium purpuratum]